MAYVIGDDCIACGTCQGECPVEAISEGEKYSIGLITKQSIKKKEVLSGWIAPLLSYRRRPIEARRRHLF